MNLRGSSSTASATQLRQSAEEHPEVDVYNVFDGDPAQLRFRRSTRKPSWKTRPCCSGPSPGGPSSSFPTCLIPSTCCAASYRTAVISDAQWVFTEPETSILGIDRRFPFMLLSSRLGYKKPDTRLVAAMDRLGVKAYESVYIGDNPHRDLVGAKMSGMRFILFRGDCRDYNGFRPDACFGEYRDLPGSP
ncbi:MAG: HAD family hydrolase [Desulfomicrobium escambiense]|nr:HAD family hydrolase [Desulfomicrobium escambiense]